MRHHLLVAAAALAIPLPAAAGVTVLGAGAARMCYLAAESTVAPRTDDLRHCDSALREEATVPRHVVATHVNRGILRLRRGDLDGAMRDFETATRLDPTEPEAYFNRGSALLRQDQAAPAAEAFSEALERNTRRPALAHFGRAVALETMGNVQAAYRDYRRASELAPQWSAPRQELTRFRVVRRTNG